MQSADIAGEFVEIAGSDEEALGAPEAYRRGYLVEPRDREMDPGLYPEAETSEGEVVRSRDGSAGHGGREALRGRPHGPRRRPPPL